MFSGITLDSAKAITGDSAAAIRVEQSENSRMKSTGRPPRVIRFRCFAFDSLRRPRAPPPARPIFFIPPVSAVPNARPRASCVQPRIVCSLFIYRFNEYIREKPRCEIPRESWSISSPHPRSHPAISPRPYRIFSTNFLPAPDFTRCTAIFPSLIPSRRTLAPSPPPRASPYEGSRSLYSRVTHFISVNNKRRSFCPFDRIRSTSSVHKSRDSSRSSGVRYCCTAKEKRGDRTRSWNLVRCFMNNLSKPSTAAISLFSSLF